MGVGDMTLYENALPVSREMPFASELEFGRRTDVVLPQSGLPLRVANSDALAGTDQGKLAVKRAMDLVISLVSLIALLPFLLVVVALIKITSRGPIFFRQQREGLDGQAFNIYKFRSMYAGQGDISGRNQTVGDDPRVTPFGRFMRTTSIDELPQLFNVLIGDMSLVGPRPHVTGMLAAGVVYDELVPYYSKRHAMKPGITGWAQANGLRGPTTDRSAAVARVDHDLAYIQNWSLGLDCRIIWMTVVRELTGGSGS